MAEQSTAPDDQTPLGERDAVSPKIVPPKRLPWLWTILILLLLPAVALALWYGGTRHRVDDYPEKVKPSPRRLAPKHRQPRTPRPAARPVTSPTAPMAPRGSMAPMAPRAPKGATK